MALKHVKPEKRVPAFHLMVTGVVFVVVFLLAVWIFSTPSEVQENVEKVGTVETYKKDTAFENTEDLPGGNEDTGWSPKKKTDLSQEFVDENGDTADEKTEPKPDETVVVTKDVETKLVDEDDEVDPKSKETKEPPKKEDEEEIKLDQVDKEVRIVDVQVEPPPLVKTSDKDVELTVENKEVSSGWESQVKESKEEKTAVEEGGKGTGDDGGSKDSTEEVEPGSDEIKPVVEGQSGGDIEGESMPEWKICGWEGAQDYIPCLDNKNALKKLKSTKHYEHRERHCPDPNDMPKCLVPLPEGYQVPITWPESRKKVWYPNVPHTRLATYKKDQNWVKRQGDYLQFPGGGTQFKAGASHYIEFIEESKSDVAWGKRTRVILDVGCGVASFGGFLFDKGVLTMSLAPKDEHEAQVQFALERGIPAISAVMGTQRLPFPSNVFDAVHCARCRVPWHIDDGRLLLELNRLLRPGGFFIWSATPVYKDEEEDRQIWRDMLRLTSKMCWALQSKTKDPHTNIGVAIFRKPMNNVCYNQRTKNYPPFCEDNDIPDAAWNIPMKSCIHKIPEGEVRGTEWPGDWPRRLETLPPWLVNIPKGLYGKSADQEFLESDKHWNRVVKNSYMTRLNIDWSHVRNVMDMNAGYGGFAAALFNHQAWVMNIVPTHEPDTLPIIYERGLFGIYHDWCESFSTYPRTYDLIHADHLFSRLKNLKLCGVMNTIIELDRILRPEGWVIFRDRKDFLQNEVLPVLNSLQWQETYTYEQDQEQLLVMQKLRWRP
eukprot:TRINITY_DN3102_c0_g1_i1.p1 TRINITY_DN3102_c0_g1~~TRINITY_DN3102_c0_g1_i1.p1  ORF type:complete len:787 (-),score=159.19 TRINITY_DN3102_c0_g1_i1:446-2758(-)